MPTFLTREKLSQGNQRRELWISSREGRPPDLLLYHKTLSSTSCKENEIKAKLLRKVILYRRTAFRDCASDL